MKRAAQVNAERLAQRSVDHRAQLAQELQAERGARLVGMSDGGDRAMTIAKLLLLAGAGTGLGTLAYMGYQGARRNDERRQQQEEELRRHQLDEELP